MLSRSLLSSLSSNMDGARSWTIAKSLTTCTITSFRTTTFQKKSRLISHHWKTSTPTVSLQSITIVQVWFESPSEFVGFDSFCTGYIYQHMARTHSKEEIEKFSNLLCIPGKSAPLTIRESKYAWFVVCKCRLLEETKQWKDKDLICELTTTSNRQLIQFL